MFNTLSEWISLLQMQIEMHKSYWIWKHLVQTVLKMVHWILFLNHAKIDTVELSYQNSVHLAFSVGKRSVCVNKGDST